VTKVIQPSPVNPTNKLGAATITVAIIELARFLVQHFAPDYYDAALWSALTPIIMFAVGYLVKDEANISVVVN
jgi:hypothetical protein